MCNCKREYITVNLAMPGNIFSSSTSVHQEDKLYVQQSVVGGKKRQLKNHSCLYCEKQISKMARHLEQVHADELEVAKVLNLTKKFKERKAAWAALVNKGDFNHNYSVIKMDPAALFQDTEPDQLNCHKLVIMYLVNTAGLCMSKQTCGNTRRPVH